MLYPEILLLEVYRACKLHVLKKYWLMTFLFSKDLEMR